MNLQQLEYILAVNEFKNFIKAAEKCFVTQPTLSMMIMKLEEELGVKIFDRSKKPIEATPHGKEIIKRAKIILGEVFRLKEFAQEFKNEISGEIKLGVIPTLAPYVVPLFIQEIISAYPGLRLIIKELTTIQIIEFLKSNEVDIGLLATPLNEPDIKEHPLFYEEFLAYSPEKKGQNSKTYMLPSEINVDQLWLLEEGHCFRSQVLNLCNLRKKEMFSSHLQYEAGSIETLINLVDRNAGITIVPLLATLKFTPDQKKKLKRFKDPKPVREVSLVVNVNFARKKILEALKKEILKNIPASYEKDRLVIDI
ncbi:LysR substrate-binding domain-containing protein [soil metagenome]